MSHEHKFSEEEVEFIKEIFAQCHPNSDSKIEAMEVARAVRCLNKSMSDHDLHQLIKHAKLDKGALVKFHEFEAILSKCWQEGFDLKSIPEKIEEIRQGHGFTEVMEKEFPQALPETKFVKQTLKVLSENGFERNNAIACIGLCRDEICKPLQELLIKAWGETFEFSSLGGMIFVGKTGMGAALHHAPTSHGKEKYVFMNMSHIGVDEYGEIGSVFRPGRHKKSNACGALCAFKNEYTSGKLNITFQPDDIEYSLLKEKMLENMEYGIKPNLIELTRIARKAAMNDLEKLIAICVNPEHADYAVISGIQIHGPHWLHKTRDMDFVKIEESYLVIDGEKKPLQIV